MKYKILLTAIALSFSFATTFAITDNQYGCGTFTIAGEQYQLTNIYSGNTMEFGHVTSVFHNKGYIYAYQTEGNNANLYAFQIPTDDDVITPSDLIQMKFEFAPEVSPSDDIYRLYFFGESSEGDIFAASFIHSTLARPAKFELFLLEPDIEAHKVIVKQEWVLPNGDNEEWGPRYPGVYGSLKSGNFSVASLVWEHPSYTSKQIKDECRTIVSCWEVKDNKPTAPVWAATDLSGAMVKPLGNNKVLVHDKQHWSRYSAKFTHSFYPFVAEVTPKQKFNVLSVLNKNCTQIDNLGCGASLFNLDGKEFIVYHLGSGENLDSDEEETSPKLGIAYLPEGPEDLSAARQFTTTLPLDNVSGNGLQDDDITHVHATRINAKKTLIYAWLPSHQHLCIYSLTTADYSADDDSGVELLTMPEGAHEYFTLQGVKIEHPTSPGIYIHKQGTKSEKLIVE